MNPTNQCHPNDIECIQKQKMVPFYNFVDKLSRKMSFKGCTVAFSERGDAINAIHNIGDVEKLDITDIQSILQASLSKSQHCDKVFQESWDELLNPQKATFSDGSTEMTIPPGMAPIIEKHISNLIEKTSEIEGMVVDEKEMEELLKQGKVGAIDISGASKELSQQLKQKCEQSMKGQGGQGGSQDGLSQCLIDINRQIRDIINQNISSGKLSKLRSAGSEVEQILDQISKDINRADMSLQEKIELKEFIKDLKQFKDILKKKIDEQIPKMDITPYFDDPDKEKDFIDKFMRGGIFNWGHPEFIDMITNLDYFKSKIREGLKELKSRKGHEQIVRTKGKVLAPKPTLVLGMKYGFIKDILYQSKPPKQKEDVVWLIDTSGSMVVSYSFIQPVVDSLDSLGVKQKFFLGTEEGTEVQPHSNFKETLDKLGSSGTVLSQAYDDIKPKVGSFKNKTFILYSDMEDYDPALLEPKLHEVVSEGGKVLILNSEKAKSWDSKFVDAVIGREPIVEFEDVNNYDRLIEVLKAAKPIIKK